MPVGSRFSFLYPPSCVAKWIGLQLSGLHFGSKKTGKNIDNFRRFINKFGLFSNRSEASPPPSPIRGRTMMNDKASFCSLIIPPLMLYPQNQRTVCPWMICMLLNSSRTIIKLSIPALNTINIPLKAVVVGEKKNIAVFVASLLRWLRINYKRVCQNYNKNNTMAPFLARLLNIHRSFSASPWFLFWLKRGNQWTLCCHRRCRS